MILLSDEKLALVLGGIEKKEEKSWHKDIVTVAKAFIAPGDFVIKIVGIFALSSWAGPKPVSDFVKKLGNAAKGKGFDLPTEPAYVLKSELKTEAFK